MRIRDVYPGQRVLVELLGEAEVVRVVGPKALARLIPSDIEILVHCQRLEQADPGSDASMGSQMPSGEPAPSRYDLEQEEQYSESRLVAEAASTGQSESRSPDGTGTPPRPPFQVRGSFPSRPGDKLRRQAIEALRYGIVPSPALQDLTVGYDQLRQWVLSRLPTSHAAGVKVSDISGPFGAGKSHAMAVVRQVALQEGYAVARTEVDGRNVTLADPQRLLHSLLGCLETRDGRSSTPVLDIYLSAIKDGKPAPKTAPQGIDRTRDNYNTVRLVQKAGCIEEFSSDLECILSAGQWRNASEVQAAICRDRRIDQWEVNVRRLVGWRVVDRPYDFVEALLGLASVCRLAGYSGLLLTIDEFEVEDFFLNQKMRQRLRALLDVLQEFVAGQTGHLPEPLALFFASVGLDGHVGDQRIKKLVKASGGEEYLLESWSTEDLFHLSEQIHDVYSDAYGKELESVAETRDKVMDTLDQVDFSSSGLIRAFIKRYVNELDARYGPPQ